MRAKRWKVFYGNSRASLTYVFTLMSLIIALGIACQGRLVKIERVPSPTPLPSPEPFPGATRLARCQAVSQPRLFFYMPTLTPEAEEVLTISGTVYALDMTPLPNALVEIWRGDTGQMNEAYPSILFGGRILTDEAGRYEFTTTKATPPKQSCLHYRVSYGDYCPLLLDLHPIVEPPSKPAKYTFARIEVTGPVLQGPVDIILPVPGPNP